MLAQGIAERSGRERISDVFLSPDAFAHRTRSVHRRAAGEVLTATACAPSARGRRSHRRLAMMYQLLESDAGSSLKIARS